MKEMCKNTSNKLYSHLNVVSLSIQIANVLFQKRLSVQSFMSVFAQKLSEILFYIHLYNKTIAIYIYSFANDLVFNL